MEDRIKKIMDEFKVNDNSFKEKGSLFYSKQDMREAWHSGVSCGVELGLNKASLEGQKLELISNTKTPKHKDFLEKFYKLAGEYNCAVQYHPLHGMVIVDLDN